MRCWSICLRRHRWETQAASSPAYAGERVIPPGYIIKFRGAELSDESRSFHDAGLVPNGAVIVLARRRRPVR